MNKMVNSSMILKNKNAVIYGAGGSLGGAVAKALAAAGAKVFLTGRSMPSVKKISDEISALGGASEFELIDALDENAVNNHINAVAEKVGTVDITFNAIGIAIVMNVPLVDLSVADFVTPITRTMESHFITAKAAAQVMIKQRSGVILTLTATPGGIGYPYNGGFAPACCAVENFSKNLAMELGIYGVRVVNMRSGGSPDSAVFRNALENQPEIMASVLKQMEADTMLKKLPLMEDVANLAVFLSSHLAGKITGVTVDVSSGTTAGLNYRVKNVDKDTNIL